MITRIVKLTFKEEHRQDFIDIFNESKDFIRSCKGNVYLALHQDSNNPNIFFTISKWTHEDNLNAYRDTDYFHQLWAKTKTLFSDKAQAWTLDELQTIGIWQ
jgi:quinol monooxygenase YgiN